MVERGSRADADRFSAEGLRRGAGGVMEGETRGRGGARPRLGPYLDGRMHLVDGGVGG